MAKKIMKDEGGLGKIKTDESGKKGTYIVIITSFIFLFIFIYLAFLANQTEVGYTSQLLFSLERSDSNIKILEEGNVTKLQKWFQDENKPISNDSIIIQKDKYHWNIIDGSKNFNIEDNKTALNILDPKTKTDVNKYSLAFEIDVGPLNITITWVDYMTFGLLSFFAMGFYFHYKEKKLSKIEEKYPDFLRDLAEFWRGGLSMTTAVETLSQGDYGALDDEVHKMATQLSWGVSFSDVLKMFKNRIRTTLIERSVSLVDQANKAGGKISDILLTAANDAREIKQLEKERNANIGQYTIVIYVSYCVYLAVIVILAYIFLPEIATTSESLVGEEGGLELIGDLNVDEISGVFFLSVLVQSIGNGLLAGLMGKSSVAAGAKHAFIMATIGWATFQLLNINVQV